METPRIPSLEVHDFGDDLKFFSGRLPDELLWSKEWFEAAWSMHPPERPTLNMPGGPVLAPRWQQAYGKDYHFTGQTSVALPVPAILERLLAWTREAIDPRLNGILLNWYDGPGHYIGPHHDAIKGLVPGSPIITISFGETRTFRLFRGQEKRNFPAASGAVFVLPFDTNLTWKHQVLKSTRNLGKRISVTIRAFTSI